MAAGGDASQTAYFYNKPTLSQFLESPTWVYAIARHIGHALLSKHYVIHALIELCRDTYVG